MSISANRSQIVSGTPVQVEGMDLTQILKMVNSGKIQTNGIATKDLIKWAMARQNADGTVPIKQQVVSRSQSFSAGSGKAKRSPASRRGSESNKNDKERIAERLAKWGNINKAGEQEVVVAQKKNSVRTVCEPEPEAASNKKEKSLRKGSTSTTVASASMVNAASPTRRRDVLKAFFAGKQQEEQPMSNKEQVKYAEMSPSTKYVWDYSRRRSSGASSANLSLLPNTGVYGATPLGNLMQSADGVILSAQGSASPLTKLFTRGRTCPTFSDSLAEVSPKMMDENRLVDFNFSLNNMIVRAEALAERSWKRLGMKKNVDRENVVFSVTVELPQVEEISSSMGKYGLASVFGQPNYCRTFDNESKWVVQNITEGRCIIRVWYHPTSNPFQKQELGIGAFDYNAERVGSKQVLSVPILSNDGKSDHVAVVQICLSDMNTKDKTDECHTNFEGQQANLFTDLYPIDSVSQVFNRKKLKAMRKTHFDRLMPSVVHAHCFTPLKKVVNTVENSPVRTPSFKLDIQKDNSPAANASTGNFVQQQCAKFEQQPRISEKSVATPKQRLSWKAGANSGKCTFGFNRSNTSGDKTTGLSLPFVGRKFGEDAPQAPAFGRQMTEESHTLSLSPSSSLPMSQIPSPPPSPPAANRGTTNITELTDDFLSVPGIC